MSMWGTPDDTYDEIPEPKPAYAPAVFTVAPQENKYVDDLLKEKDNTISMLQQRLNAAEQKLQETTKPFPNYEVQYLRADNTNASCFDTPIMEKPSVVSKEEQVNPMECFILFLQNENLLDLFIEAQVIDFDEIVEYEPISYLEAGLSEDVEVPSNWEAANKAWQNVVNTLNINELEAWYE